VTGAAPGPGAHATTRPDVTVAVANLVRFLETGTAPRGLFAPDVFADVSLPRWRVQTETAGGIEAVRSERHPFPGTVRVGRVDETETGFTVELEERWEDEGQRWYCREMFRADVVDDAIVDLAVYCTGDWDEARQREHAGAVQLVRP
jgi:hypothetical protein